MRPRNLPPAPRASFIAFALALTGPALADPLSDVRGELDEITESVQKVEQDYLAPAILERQNKLTARLNDGQLFFFTQDYDRAAMSLLDLVEDPRSRQHPGYRDALYFLAESLFQLRNYKAATTYYELVAANGKNPEAKSDSRLHWSDAASPRHL